MVEDFLNVYTECEPFLALITHSCPPLSPAEILLSDNSPSYFDIFLKDYLWRVGLMSPSLCMMKWWWGQSCAGLRLVILAAGEFTTALAGTYLEDTVLLQSSPNSGSYSPSLVTFPEPWGLVFVDMFSVTAQMLTPLLYDSVFENFRWWLFSEVT